MTQKRNRLTLVCTFCKRRKVRCDKGLPCSTCIKYGNDECEYKMINDESLFQERDMTALRNEIGILKKKLSRLEAYEVLSTEEKKKEFYVPTALDPFGFMIANNPVSGPEDKINFYCHAPVSINQSGLLRQSHEPIDWVSLMKRDKVLSVVLEFLIMKATMKHSSDYWRASKNGPKYQLEDGIEGSKDLELYSRNGTGSKSLTVFNKLNLVIGSPSFDQADDESNKVKLLCERIQLALPNKKTLLLLIERFFSHLYVYFPLLDYDSFTKNIFRILVPDSNDENSTYHVKVEKKIDFALLGLLLILLRLTYLPLQCDGDPIKMMKIDDYLSPEVQYLQLNPIDLNVVEISRLCLSQFDVITNRSIELLQLLLFLRFYHMFAPEEGEGDKGYLSVTFNGLLLNIATSLGLNRDPDVIFGKSMDEKSKNLSRKLWWLIYCLHLQKSVESGSKLMISSLDFDTKAPTYTPEGVNCKNDDIEKEAVSLFALKHYKLNPLLDLFNLVLNIRGDFNMRDIAERIGEVEKTWIEGYGKLINRHKDGKNDNIKDSVLRYDIKNHTLTSTLVACILLNFVNYYELKNCKKLMLYYIKKIVIMIGYDLIPLCLELISMDGLKFSIQTYLMVIPDLLSVIHKSAIILTAFYVRCRIDLVKCSGNPDHSKLMVNDKDYCSWYRMLDRTCALFESLFKSLRDTLVAYSPRYFYAWRLSKRMSTFYDIITGDELYHSCGLSNMKGFQLTYEYLGELHCILNNTNNSINQTHKMMSRQDHPEGYDVTDSVSTPTFDDLPSVVPMLDINGNINCDEIDKLWMDMMSKNEKHGHSRPSIAEQNGSRPEEPPGIVGDGDFRGILSEMDNTTFDEMLRSFLEKN